MLIIILIGTIQIGRVLKKLLFTGYYYPVKAALNIRAKFQRLLGMDKMGKTTSSGNMPSNSFIFFNKDEKQHCFDSFGRKVTVVASPGKHDHGSSRVKVQNIVDYKWEQRNYPGRLIACYGGGKLIAYAITVNHRATPEGMVRIVHLMYSQRSLIKGMSGEVLDLQFAHNSSKVLLGIIERDALHVHKIDVINEKVSCTLLLKITDPIENHIPLCDKISWCPYLQENGYEDEYASHLLVWTRGRTFHCYSISAVIQHHGTGQFSGQDITGGGFKFRDSLPVITEAIFSADGTTLAIGCKDGIIRFYQVYQHTIDSNPRCLHEWTPHDGKEISSFFFLDNYTAQGGDQTLWKHAITCSDNNTEIKVWCCETWECSQTIRFIPSIDQPLYFKAEIDPTSSYLVLSDMVTRILYVLQVRKETVCQGNGALSSITNGKVSDDSYSFQKANDNKSSEENNSSVSSVNAAGEETTSSVKPYIACIAEFPLSSHILSFGIRDAGVRMFRTNDAYLIDELDDFDEENGALYCVVIRMYLVQPKSVQECFLFYQPNVTFETDVRSTVSSINSEYRNVSQSSGSSQSKDEHKNTSLSENKISTSGVTESALNLSSEKLVKSNESTDLQKTLSPASANVGTVQSSILGGSKTNNLGSVIIGGNGVTRGHANDGHTKHAINLMTPDSFNSTTTDKNEKQKNEETVNPDVLNTLFMLANVTKQQQAQQQQLKGASNENVTDKPSPLNMLNIVNSTMIEEQEQEKVRKSVEQQQKAVLETPPVPPMPSAEMLASGGSSPSREVQEILSLKDNDCLNEYYDSDNVLLDETDGIGADEDELNDLENEIIDDEAEDVEYNFKNIDDDDTPQERRVKTKQSSQIVQNLVEVSSNVRESQHDKSLEIKNKVDTNSGLDWPKVPGVPHQAASSFMPSVQPINKHPQPPIVMTAPPNSKQLEDLTKKMDRLLSITQKQSSQILDIHTKLAQIEQLQPDLKRIQDILVSHEQTISKNIETSMHTFRNHLMEQLIAEMQPRIQLHLVDPLTKSICVHLMEKLTPALRKELQGLDVQIGNSMRINLKATEHVFESTAQKLFSSEIIYNALSRAVQRELKDLLKDGYHEAMLTIMIPAFEKSTQELFRQLNTAFYAGTREYLKKLELWIQHNRQITERANKLVEVVEKVPEQINTNYDQSCKENAKALQEDLNRDFKQLQANLLKVICENVRHEIQKGLEAQASSLEDSVLSAVRSQAQTPAPSNVDIQEQIRQYLGAAQINKAFHKALLSNDLTLVEYTMEKADYKLVFNPCPLEQTVLLSLIQQISADMGNHNELKHRYLSDSIVSLNFLDPITKEHAPKVMRELTQNCQNFLSANPGSQLGTSIKMLMIAIQGLGFKQF